MARQLIEQVTDDLDGGRADTTVSFSWDGTAYEIDLSRKNASAFEKVLRPYLSAARKARSGATNSRRATRSPRGSSSRRQSRDLGAVREWAKENGHQVSERGRISSAILQAYDEAH